MREHDRCKDTMALKPAQGDMIDTSVASGTDALRALEPIKIINATPKFTYSTAAIRRCLPSPSIQRRIDSLSDAAVKPHSSSDLSSRGSPDGPDGPDGPDPPTVFYLAYGSNLSAETFQGKRGIRPISQLNVLVPELALTFDLAGIPYLEPCFANTKYRSQKSPEAGSEKSPPLPLTSPTRRYHKTRWGKGLVGAVYEVTREDFARIISSEGGGASYHDILVDCYELPLGENVVPMHPISQPFKAHTLFSPSFLPGSDAPRDARRPRPDPNYAQPSRRYLKLITDGADEHHLPAEYKLYLRQIRPYLATTKGQKIGGALFMMAWFPLFIVLFTLAKLLADKQGHSPSWLSALFNALFKASWASYDSAFKRIFGDGERTVGDNEDDGDDHKEADIHKKGNR